MPETEKKALAPPYHEGVYTVGKEIPLGEYYVVNQSDDNNPESSNFYYITVNDSEYLSFIPTEEAYLLKGDSFKPINLDEFKYGMFKVGRDIPEGVYSVEWAKGSGSYRVMNSSHNYGEETVEECTVYVPDKKVELKNGQYIRIFNLSIRLEKNN